MVCISTTDSFIRHTYIHMRFRMRDMKFELQPELDEELVVMYRCLPSSGVDAAPDILMNKLSEHSNR